MTTQIVGVFEVLMQVFNIDDKLHIPMFELEFAYSRSSGPGGQNVNKVNSKATLTWRIDANTSLPRDVMQRLKVKAANRLTVGGELVISSDRHRDQRRNSEDCLAKLADIIREIAVPPTPRRKTKPTRGAVERRIESKRMTAQRKNSRGRVRDW
jgi:ribosome-associated protein